MTPFPFNPWRFFPEAPRRGPQEGIGSGFFIRDDGYLLTNHHVVAGATAVTVIMTDGGKTLKARVIGSDPRSDLALLKVKTRRKLPVLPLGSSDQLPVGAWVVAIGNPFGLAHVATKGIVSGKGRTLGDLPRPQPGYFDFIQTDAAIDRGNSGGPLLNLQGEVVGINTAINSRARGIGFAVPVDLAKAVLPQLQSRGQVTRSYLGISIDPVTWELAESFGRNSTSGVLITKVLPDTPAQRAGLRKGDIMVKIAGKSIQGPGDMSWRAATATIGKPMDVEIWRANHQEVIQITPVARASSKKSASKPAPREARDDPPRLGLLAVDLDKKTVAASGLPQATRGVVVVGVEGDAAQYGIRVGDVITSVNDTDIANKAEFDKAIAGVKQGSMLRFYILRQKSALYVALPKRWK
jgi:serine protease Do